MKGTRPLDNNEIRLVSVCFDGTFEIRNRGLFMIGVSTGGRISELLSLQIGDVYQNGRPVTDLLFDKSVVKGGEVSRAVPVNSDGRRAIDRSDRLASGPVQRIPKRVVRYFRQETDGAKNECPGGLHTMF